MMNVPPDPSAAETAELRSEDDGMPVHPAKSEDQAGYAAEHAERERKVAAGYPVSRIGRAYADAIHSASHFVDDLLAPKNRSLVTVAGLLGFGLAMLLIERSVAQPVGTRRGKLSW